MSEIVIDNATSPLYTLWEKLGNGGYDEREQTMCDFCDQLMEVMGSDDGSLLLRFSSHAGKNPKNPFVYQQAFDAFCQMVSMKMCDNVEQIKTHLRIMSDELKSPPPIPKLRRYSNGEDEDDWYAADPNIPYVSKPRHTYNSAAEFMGYP